MQVPLTLSTWLHRRALFTLARSGTVTERLSYVSIGTLADLKATMGRMADLEFNTMVEKNEPYQRCDLISGAGSLQLPETQKMYETAGCPLAGPLSHNSQGAGTPATPGQVSAGNTCTDLSKSLG